MTDTPQLLLGHHLKALKLPTFLREYEKLARQCAAEGLDHVRFLLRLVELELIDRERRMVERRIKEARFPAVKSLDSFDFAAIPSLNKTLVLELARSEYATRRENVIAVGNSGTGKTHIALGIGLAACQKGLSVGFYTAAALVHELLEARDEKRLLRLQRQVAGYKLLIIDLDMSLSPRPGPSCCSKYSASATSAVQPSSHRTCRSTNGPACSGPSV
jgi:DNA replication protein DnaC